jgi:hypothetical protein
MKRRVVLELVGTIGVHEVSGGAAVAAYTPWMIGLTLAEGKPMMSAVQHHLVQAQTEDHCRRRRRCQRCRAQRPVKISAPGGWCRCSAWWRFARHALPHAGAR